MKIEEKVLSGERAEYFSSKNEYENVTFRDGESCLKHSENISVNKSVFQWKYPLWCSRNVKVDNSVFMEMGKSGIWYTNDISIENTIIKAPKEFRRCNGITLKNVVFENAAETMWTCRNMNLSNVRAKGDYFAMNSSDFYCENFTLDGNYFLDGGKNIEIHNSTLNSKDAFWNCENVTVYNSTLIGEYLGWHSKNLKFVNCHIESNQGLCYIDGLVLENCTFDHTDLAFEYCSNIDVEVTTRIESVKNPLSGKIKAPEIGMLIMNPSKTHAENVEIQCPEIEKTYSEDPNPNENLY